MQQQQQQQYSSSSSAGGVPSKHSMTTVKQWALRRFRALIYAFNVKALLLCAIAVLSVAASQYVGLTYNVDFSFIALGITFPLTFNSESHEG